MKDVRWMILFVFVAPLLSLACGGGQLTRSKAAALLAAHANFTDGSIHISDRSSSEGFELGLWSPAPGFGGAFGARATQSPVLATIFRASVFQGQLALAEPFEWRVTVTGITDSGSGSESGSSKNVEFEAIPARLPAWLKRPDLTTKREGVAQFRLYDDGWRVEAVRLSGDIFFSIDWNAVPGVGAELERRKAAAAAEEAQRERIRLAETSTRVLDTIDSPAGVCPGGSADGNLFFRVRIADAAATVELWKWGRTEVQRTYPYRRFSSPEARPATLTEYSGAKGGCAMLVFDPAVPPAYAFSQAAAFFGPTAAVAKAEAQVAAAIKAWRAVHKG
jgi:hypothetical protein